ncbi:glycosyltransferase [Enterococcus gilvus]|uniref:glycosyltransferase n=1 Tax=Enterococcus gilvus TaxID=160453 RepID=UPI003D6BF92F
MIYHLNVNVGKKLTGIERAAIQRHNLLKKTKNSVFVTIRYNSDLKQNMELYGISDSEYINMYDFFQGTSDIKKYEPISLKTVFNKENCKFEKVKDANDFRVFYNDKYVAYAHLDSRDNLIYINYFDSNRKKRKRHIYDQRGFLSSEFILDSDQNVLLETYYSPMGEKKVEKFYQYGNIKKETLINIYDKGNQFILSSEEELITFFLERILTKNDIAISDKNIVIANSLAKVSNVKKKIAILHSKHYSGLDVQNGRISAPYKYVFDNLDTFDYVICSTKQQQADLLNRFDNDGKFICIPVGIKKNVNKNDLKLDSSSIIRIGVVARYYSEKRLDHVIKAFSVIHSLIPNTELHLYGFGDSREQYQTEKDLIYLREQLSLADVVKFRGYFVNLDNEYKKMHVLLLTSKYEGFCLALLEGISYGIPAVSYDINYGPKEMIDSGNSGYLAKNGSIEDLANKVIKVLDDPYEYELLSEQAYKKSNEFSEDAIRRKWEEIL